MSTLKIKTGRKYLYKDTEIEIYMINFPYIYYRYGDEHNNSVLTHCNIFNFIKNATYLGKSNDIYNPIKNSAY